VKAIGVIPARGGATRFEGKVIANLLGKPVVQHVWENAKKAKTLDDLVVACDEERIVKVVEGFGGTAVYTSPNQPSGTDRLAEVVNPLDIKIAVNIQGDEPLIEPLAIDQLAAGGAGLAPDGNGLAGIAATG
jgi:3-deoxy-manno-octulosonate cytidylyltransferase (CMP-KDO synthetase)